MLDNYGDTLPLPTMCRLNSFKKSTFYWDEDSDYFSLPLDLEAFGITDLKEIFEDVSTKVKNESMHDVKCTNSDETEEKLSILKSESCCSYEDASSTAPKDTFDSENTSVYDGTIFCEKEIDIDANKSDNYSSINDQSSLKADIENLSINKGLTFCGQGEINIDGSDSDSCINDANSVKDASDIENLYDSLSSSDYKSDNASISSIEYDACSEYESDEDDVYTVTDTISNGERSLKTYNVNIKMIPNEIEECIGNIKGVDNHVEIIGKTNEKFEDVELPHNENILLSTKPAYKITATSSSNTAEQQMSTCSQWIYWGQTDADILLERPLYNNTWPSVGKQSNKNTTEVQIPTCSQLDQYEPTCSQFDHYEPTCSQLDQYEPTCSQLNQCEPTKADNYGYVDRLDRVQADCRNMENVFLRNLEIFNTKNNNVIGPPQRINTLELNTEEVNTKIHDTIEPPQKNDNTGELTSSQKLLFQELLSETDSEESDIDFTETETTIQDNISYSPVDNSQRYLYGLKQPKCDDTEELDIFVDFKSIMYGEDETSEEESVQVGEIEGEETGLYQSEEEESDDEWDSDDEMEFEQYMNDRRFRNSLMNFLYNHPNAVEWLQEIIDHNWSQVRFFDFPLPDLIRRRRIWFLFNPKKKKKKKKF